MKHTKITQTERDLIGQWKKERIANKEIARRLGRPVLTIRRELKRNRTRVTVGDHTSGLKRQQVAH
jgi:IS30 family transposase